MFFVSKIKDFKKSKQLKVISVQLSIGEVEVP